MKIIVGRAINGITINGFEYLQNGKGEIVEFDTEQDAREFLFSKGTTCDYLIFEEVIRE
jgi:hypothetical protein